MMKEADSPEKSLEDSATNDEESSRPSLMRLLKLAMPEMAMLIISFIFVLGSEAANMVTPLIVANAYDALINPMILDNAQRMSEIGAAADGAWNTGAIETLRDAVRAQGEKTGLGWADALSSSVRPVITYWFMALYCAAKTAAFAAALSAGADWGTAVLRAWTEADQALWAGVLNFWFLGRVFDKVRP